MFGEIASYFMKAAELPGFATDFVDADLIIAGVPSGCFYSEADGFRASLSRIRLSLGSIETLSPFSGLDIIDLKFHDLGDFIVTGDSLEEQQVAIKAIFSRILATGKKLGLMSTDSTILLPVFDVLKQHQPDAGLVIFDASFDPLHSPASTGFPHQGVLGKILQLHPGTPVLHIGCRTAPGLDTANTEEERGKITLVKAIDFQGRELTDVKDKIATFFDVHQGKIHVSINVNCFDPSVAPGVIKPEFPGLTALQVFQTLHWIKNDVTSFNLCGFIPSRDVNGVTAVLAAKTLCELMFKTAGPSMM